MPITPDSSFATIGIPRSISFSLNPGDVFDSKKTVSSSIEHGAKSSTIAPTVGLIFWILSKTFGHAFFILSISNVNVFLRIGLSDFSSLVSSSLGFVVESFVFGFNLISSLLGLTGLSTFDLFSVGLIFIDFRGLFSLTKSPPLDNNWSMRIDRSISSNFNVVISSNR